MWKHWSINKIKPFMFAFIVNNRGNGRRIVFQYTNILKSLDIIARIKIIGRLYLLVGLKWNISYSLLPLTTISILSF